MGVAQPEHSMNEHPGTNHRHEAHHEMDEKVRALHDDGLVEEKESDGKQTGARSDQDEDKNHDVTEVLHLCASAQFFRRRAQDREPGQAEDANGKRIPGYDTLSGGLDSSPQGEPESRRNSQRDNNAVSGVLFSDPVHGWETS